ncbi:MAG: menaquinone biosynthesis decarboxylase [Bacteroidales bacterium]
MAYKNLQHFIKTLEAAGELVRVKEFVSPVLEMTEIADRLVKNGGKAVLFENNGTGFPVLMNAMGTEKRMCMALGVSHLDAIGREMGELFNTISMPREGLWEKLKLLPSFAQVSSWFPSHKKGRGECQEMVMEKPDLSVLPVLTCWPYDGGPFITFPVVHTRDPENNTRNIGMYRMQVFDSATTGMHWHLHKNSARHYHAYKRLKKRMPVTVTLGGDPAYTYAATAPMPDNVDEYLLAGFLRKKKVEMVKCLTNDLEVPSDVDIVIEGYVDTEENLRIEGPFGDHTGFYSLPDYYPVFHVTCITHRKDAVYPATIVGIPPQEDLFMGKATERIFLMPIRMTMLPEIRDMHMPAEGVFHNLVLTNINNTYPGQAFKVMNSLWGAGQMMFNKVLVVLNEEMDNIPVRADDYKDLFNRVLYSFNPDKDVFFSKGPVDVLDHASKEFAFGGKLGIDATHCGNEAVIVTKLYKIIPLKKNSSGQVRQLAKQMLLREELQEVKLLVFIEEFVDSEDYSTIVWRVLNNIDPDRDCYLLSKPDAADGSVLVVDGTRKYRTYDGFTRPWPNCTVMNDATISKIDELWQQLALGPFQSSPSLKYKAQVYPGEAEVSD